MLPPTSAPLLSDGRVLQEVVLQVMTMGLAQWVVWYAGGGALTAPITRAVRAPVLEGERGGSVGRIPARGGGRPADVAPLAAHAVGVAVYEAWRGVHGPGPYLTHDSRSR